MQQRGNGAHPAAHNVSCPGALSCRHCSATASATAVSLHRCKMHAYHGDEDVKHQRCAFSEGCSVLATYGLRRGQPLFCKAGIPTACRKHRVGNPYSSWARSLMRMHAPAAPSRATPLGCNAPWEYMPKPRLQPSCNARTSIVAGRQTGSGCHSGTKRPSPWSFSYLRCTMRFAALR